jgi:hypothetical protein
MNGIAVDQSGNIFAVNSSNKEILEFAPASNGDVAPSAVIQGPSTLLTNTRYIAI